MAMMSVSEDPHRTWLGDSRDLHWFKSVRAEAKTSLPCAPVSLTHKQLMHTIPLRALKVLGKSCLHQYVS